MIYMCVLCLAMFLYALLEKDSFLKFTFKPFYYFLLAASLFLSIVFFLAIFKFI